MQLSNRLFPSVTNEYLGITTDSRPRINRFPNFTQRLLRVSAVGFRFWSRFSIMEFKLSTCRVTTVRVNIEIALFQNSQAKIFISGFQGHANLLRDRSAMVKFVDQPKEDCSSLQKGKLLYPYPYKTKLKSVQNPKMEPLREHGPMWKLILQK